MGGFFGAISKQDCVLDIFFGVDYHSHLGTRRGGMAIYDRKLGFQRQIHDIENTPFRTKFENNLAEFHGCAGIGCISDIDPRSASSTTPSVWCATTFPAGAISSWSRTPAR